MADFEQIQSIQTVANENDLKGLLKLKIAGATEPLTISCPSLSAAEDMAGLIDGYCKLVNSGKESCWNRKGTCLIRIVNVLTELVTESIVATAVPVSSDIRNEWEKMNVT